MACVIMSPGLGSVFIAEQYSLVWLHVLSHSLPQASGLFPALETHERNYCAHFCVGFGVKNLCFHFSGIPPSRVIAGHMVNCT